MISQLGAFVSALFRRLVPDPFVIAILLTLVTVGLALLLTPSSLDQVLAAWSSDAGVWALLKFAMQMCLVLVTGHAVASSPPVARLLSRLAEWPSTQRQAVWLVAFGSCVLGVLNWGLALIAGALLAREVGRAMGRKGVPTHYPLLAASGYLCMLVWHGGLSGSAPLKVTTVADLREIFGPNPPIGPIPLSETIFSPLNLWVTGGLLVLVPLFMALLSPTHGIRQGSEFLARGMGMGADLPTPRVDDRSGFVRFLEDSPVVTAVLVLLLGAWAWRYFFPSEGPSGIRSLSLDAVNLAMLLAGLVLHRTPLNYVRAIDRAAGDCGGIVLQFPLYAGVMGIVRTSGLSDVLAGGFTAAASPAAIPILTFFAACIVNFLVPSGGGQWAVQGPVAVAAAVRADVDPSRIVLAVAYGDQVTNMLQPFWTLPLLAITKCEARDLVGYTALAMLVGGAWILTCLLLA